MVDLRQTLATDPGMARRAQRMRNLDPDTVKGFGREWTTFNQGALSESERGEIFQQYFSLIDWTERPRRALDMGCGSGRWAALAAPMVDSLVAADASSEALAVARRNINAANVSFAESTPEDLPFPDGHFDLIFSLGVLHHVPDTEGAIGCLARKLSPGGTLLLYLYYAFDNRPAWYRFVWRASDLGRRLMCRLPFSLRHALSEAIAILFYWPLARMAKYLPLPASWPLRYYANRSLYVMRTDALDRFGTKVEKRFSRKQIVEMLQAAELSDVKFSDSWPYWVCKAIKPAYSP